MKPRNLTGMLLCVLMSFNHVSAQDKINIKFGKITPEDFSPSSPAIDSSSKAVVLADVGSTDFEGNNTGYFTLIFKLHERVLIKQRSAFDEATVKVLLFTGVNSFAERFEDFEASTFYMENGKIIETKIDKNAIFKEKYNRNFTSLKFTLPNIKEGCIIEYKYTIKSPFYNNNIRSWQFQGEYPVLWSEYKVVIPSMFNYAILRQGYLNFAKDTVWNVFKTYSIIDPGDASSSSDLYSLSGDAHTGWWVMKDVPAFKSEKYLASSKNYISKIRFQLHSIRYSESHVVQKLKDWFSTIDDMLKDPEFGQPLNDDNSWLSDELKKITVGTSGVIKARKIYEYVRDHFTCTDDDASSLSETLKKIYQAKKGNVADINILLTAMLINQGFDAHPVILSTRDNGRAMEAEAVLDQYNYVLCRLKVDSVYYLLDASVNRLGFGKLTSACYNDNGRLIDKPPYLIYLSADSLIENKSTIVFITNDEKGNEVNGALTSNLGYLESTSLRDKIAKSKQEDVVKDMVKEYPPEIEVSNMLFDSLKIFDEPIAITHDFKVKFDDDIVYFNPMLNEAWKNNPFVAEKRFFPVEMPYKMNQMYVLNMEIPKGYKVDEMPKSARINLNGDEGKFEYLIVSDASNIQFRTNLVLRKANFTTEDYASLREFFSYIVKKEAEQIVFKKIK